VIMTTKALGRRAGFSEVISTVILSATILSTAIVASFVATSYLEYQSQYSEFEQAKENLVRFAEMVDDSVSNPGYGGFVRLNLRSSRLVMLRDHAQLSVSISGVGTVLSDSFDVLLLQGGNDISASNSWLRGNGLLVVSGAADPLGHVKTYQYNGALARLDFGRVKVMKLGTFRYFNLVNGTGGYVDEFQISYVNMTVRGSQAVPGAMNLMARNVEVTTRRFVITSDEPLTVLVNSSDPELSTQVQLGRSGGSIAIVVNLVVADVEVTAG